MRIDPCKRTILIIGVNGQIGFELVRSLQGLGKVVAMNRQAFDLSDIDQMRRVVRELRPTLIVNAAAYTAVDQAERNRETALRINAQAPGVLAEEARRLNAVLIHYSTDHVFDGAKVSQYVEDDATGPLNVYGASKLAGERAITETGAAHLIFRTSWVYGRRGKNFLLTILQMANRGERLSIVADQFGAPTWSRTIATVTSHILAQGLMASASDIHWWFERSGVYHMTASGTTSWAGFAAAIFDLIATEVKPEITPVTLLDYPAAAKRPINSHLSNDKLTRTFGMRVPDWRDTLRICLER